MTGIITWFSRLDKMGDTWDYFWKDGQWNPGVVYKSEGILARPHTPTEAVGPDILLLLNLIETNNNKIDSEWKTKYDGKIKRGSIKT